MWLAVLLVVSLKVSVATPAGPWWGNAVYYRLLVDSFKDGDGDGLGDLIGATKQVSYVRALGADAVILSSLASSSGDCTTPGGLELSSIDVRYGTLADFTAFIEKAQKLELKVIITLSLQRISTASEWFKASANRTLGFENWILWRDKLSDETSTANATETWVWHEGRSSYWASSNNESLLNLCDEGVSAALSAAQCGWLKRGVSGMLLKPDFPYDQNCAEKLVKKMAADAMSCARASNLETPVILVESSQAPEVAARYYADGNVGANSVVSTALTSAGRHSASALGLAILASIIHAPADGTPVWVASPNDESRLATRLGNDMVDAINLLSLILPGAAIIQQGDELGAADTILEWASFSNTCWPTQPNPAAAPFSWDTTTNAGFTAGEPWLPLAPNYRYANAKTQFTNDASHVGVVRVAAAMRKSPAIGPHAEIKRLGPALAVLRWGGTGSLMVISNLGREQTEIQLSGVPGLPAELTVATSSAGSSMAPGSHVAVEKPMKLRAGETVLFAGAPRHCGGPGPVDKITNKLAEGWQKLNKYFGTI